MLTRQPYATEKDVRKTMLVQSGMREESMGTIELGDMQGPVLEALMEYFYGCLTEIPAQLLLPLFVAADAHQVSLTTTRLQDKFSPKQRAQVHRLSVSG